MMKGNDLMNIDLENAPRNNNDDDKYYYSCGKRIDRRLMKFCSQIGMSFLVIGFSIYQLGRGDLSPEASNVYIGLLSSTFSIWVPSPSLK